MAFFLYDENNVLVGFAMIHPYSNLGETPDFVLAEFTIFPMYRRKHLAKTAAEMIFDLFEGYSEVRLQFDPITCKNVEHCMMMQTDYGPTDPLTDCTETFLRVHAPFPVYLQSIRI